MQDVSCVVCGLSGSELCSYACLETSMRERDENVAALYQLGDTPRSRDRRRALEQRNGEITSALLAWRPDPSRPDPSRAIDA